MSQNEYSRFDACLVLLVTSSSCQVEVDNDENVANSAQIDPQIPPCESM